MSNIVKNLENAFSEISTLFRASMDALHEESNRQKEELAALRARMEATLDEQDELVELVSDFAGALMGDCDKALVKTERIARFVYDEMPDIPECKATEFIGHCAICGCEVTDKDDCDFDDACRPICAECAKDDDCRPFGAETEGATEEEGK